jgi:hypothetical protein
MSVPVKPCALNIVYIVLWITRVNAAVFWLISHKPGKMAAPDPGITAAAMTRQDEVGSCKLSLAWAKIQNQQTWSEVRCISRHLLLT